MHNKTVTILLAILVLIMGASYFAIKNYIFGKEDMVGKIQMINHLVEQEEWSEAEILVKELQNIWENNRNLVQINFAEQDYAQFEDHLNSLESGIKAKDIASALSNAKELKHTWQTLNAVVPEP